MENNISVKQIIHYSGILVLMVSVIYGLLYITEGQEVISFLLGLLSGGFFFFIVRYMVIEKPKSSRGTPSSVYIVYIVMYIFLFLLTSPIIIHFLGTEIALKNIIKDEGIAKLNALEKMVEAYEDEAELDTAEMSSTIGSHLGSYFNLPVSDFSNRTKYETALKKAPFNFKFDKYEGNDIRLRPYLFRQKPAALSARYLALMEGIKNIKESNQAFLQKASPTVNQWRRLKLNRVLYEADKHLAANLASLKSKKKNFNFPLPQQKISISNPFLFFQQYNPNWLLCIGTLILLHLLILWPVLFMPNSGKSYNNTAESTGTKL